ncbi:MAG: HNH endonuclease [Sedimentisphaerales bacterium]
MINRVMERKELQKIDKGIQKGIYRTFKVNGQTIIIDDFIYRRLFREPDIKPRRKYTFIQGFHFAGGYPLMVLKNDKSVRLSRYIMHAVKDDFVDHINRNRLDNRRCNLRLVTARQNNLNRGIKNNTGLIGVSKGRTKKNKKHFCVRTDFRTKQGHRLGFHCPDTPFNRILTALAHDKFVLQEGEEEYAPLNFPQWQSEPLRRILMKEDLSKFKERKKGVKGNPRSFFAETNRGDIRKKRKLNQQILRFCRKRANKIEK